MDTTETSPENLSADLALYKKGLDKHAIVAVTDGRGRIMMVNSTFCRISGYSKEELIGQDHRIINSGHHPKEFFSEMYRTISSGQVWHGLIKNRAKDGSFYWVQTTIVPEIGADGKPTRYIAVRDDVTALKKTEEELLAANHELARRIEEIDWFVHSVSHDLKSPLVTILGYCSLLQEGLGEIDEKSKDAFRRIDSAARRMKLCIDDLLRLNKMGHSIGLLEWIDLARFVAEQISVCGHQLIDKGILLKYSFAEPAVYASRPRLTEVVQNLLSNAIRYGSTADSPQIEIGSCKHEGGVAIFVRDNGEGIDPKHHTRIFQLFERLRPDSSDGTGVGLAIVQRAMSSLKGRAWVESAIGKGSTFWVLFPVPSQSPTSKSTMRADK